MKSSTILIGIFLILCLSLFLFVGADSGEVTLASVLSLSTHVNQGSDIGLWTAEFNYTNITDGSLSTHGKGNGTYFFNVSRMNDSTDSTIVQFTFNASSGNKSGENYTLSDFSNCWDEGLGKLIFKVESNATTNISNFVTNEVIVLRNDTNITLANTQVINATAIVFNQSDGAILHHNNFTIDFEPGNITLTPLAAPGLNGTTWGINYTYLTQTTPSNALYCSNSTDWFVFNSFIGGNEIFDVRVFWNISSRTSNIVFNLTKPAEYAMFTASAVNFSWIATDLNSDENHTNFNCSVYTKTNRSASRVENLSDIPTTNATEANGTISFVDGDRVWWNIVCEDQYAREMGSSLERIFDVDTDYQVLSLGANKRINFTLNTGDINIVGTYGVNGSRGLTSNYSVGGCWFVFAGGIMHTTNCTIV